LVLSAFEALDDTVGGDDAVVRGLGLRGLLDGVVQDEPKDARGLADGSEREPDGFVVRRGRREAVELVGELDGLGYEFFVRGSAHRSFSFSR
jgi:hypothetical protein